MVAPDGRGPTGDDFLARLKNRDSRAWEELTDQVGARLHSYLRRSLPDGEVVDAVSETWLGAVRGIQTFDGNVSIVTFIFSIANRKVADFWRQSKPTAELQEWMSSNGPDEDSVIVRQALALLPDESRQVLLLRYHMGFTVGEVADIINRTYKATESLLSRARKQLQDILNDLRRDR